MSREVRRVPLDFDWPLNKVWGGYQSPDWRPCPSLDCEHGSTIAARYVECLAHLMLMVGEAGVSSRGLHPWLQEIPLGPGRKPGPDAAELSTGLAGRPPGMIGHDAIDRWSTVKKIKSAAGVSEDWGICPTCKGHTIHPDDIEASEAWRPTEPPTGEGWQLWETVTEGSPITPVFPTAEALATHLVEHEGYRRAAADQLVSRGNTVGTAAVIGGAVFDSGKDADHIEFIAASLARAQENN